MSGKICDTLNNIILLNEALVEELTKARNTIGLKGHLNHRVELPRFARGSWASGVRAIAEHGATTDFSSPLTAARTNVAPVVRPPAEPVLQAAAEPVRRGGGSAAVVQP